MADFLTLTAHLQGINSLIDGYEENVVGLFDELLGEEEGQVTEIVDGIAVKVNFEDVIPMAVLKEEAAKFAEALKQRLLTRKREIEADLAALSK